MKKWLRQLLLCCIGRHDWVYLHSPTRYAAICHCCAKFKAFRDYDDFCLHAEFNAKRKGLTP